MSNATGWELLLMLPAFICAAYAIIWAVPGVIMSSIVALGSYKHIVFIDKQLAKNLDKYYDENGQMRARYQISSAIQTRFMNYCITYPFIRHREKTNSVKFKVFMWVNTLGFWSFGIFTTLGIIAKLFNIIP